MKKYLPTFICALIACSIMAAILEMRDNQGNWLDDLSAILIGSALGVLALVIWENRDL